MWIPDAEECFLPAKVEAPFQSGSVGKVSFEDGTVRFMFVGELYAAIFHGWKQSLCRLRNYRQLKVQIANKWMKSR